MKAQLLHYGPIEEQRSHYSGIKYLIIGLLFGVVFISCSGIPEDDGILPPSIFSSPNHIKLNLEEGYMLNQLSGDPIKPIINSLGDTVKTGVELSLEGTLINPDSVEKPKIFPKNHEIAAKDYKDNFIPIDIEPIKITVNQEQLSIIPIPIVEEGDTSHYFINSKGAKIPTGIPIPANREMVQLIQPQPITARPPRYRDNAIFNFQFLSIDEGMPSNDVHSLLEDRNGNLWFGTHDGGLTRYDGTTFTHFTKENGLPSNGVSAIIEDSEGAIWIATHGGGVIKFDGAAFTVYNEDSGLLSNMIIDLKEDRNGNIWILTPFGITSLSHMENGIQETYLHFTHKEGFTKGAAFSFSEDLEGNLWFGASDGLYRLTLASNLSSVRSEPEKMTMSVPLNTQKDLPDEVQGFFTIYTFDNGPLDKGISSLTVGSNGNLWLGRVDGTISQFDGNSFRHHTPEHGLKNSIVLSIMEDKPGHFWFGKFNIGLGYYDGTSVTYYTENDGIPNNRVQSIIKDRAGNIWFGTGMGGVCRLGGKAIRHFIKDDALFTYGVVSILEEKKNKFLLATWGDGLSQLNLPSKGEPGSFVNIVEQEIFPIPFLRTMTKDIAGNLWIGTAGGGAICYDGSNFIKFTDQEGLSNNAINHIFSDENNNLWFATNGGGLSRYDNSYLENKASGFIHYKDKDGLLNNWIRTIFMDSRGNLWLGTLFSGISRIVFSEDNKNGIITHFTEREGLSNNNISTFYEDREGNFWIGTWGGGLVKFNIDEIHGIDPGFVYFTENEGLSSNYISSINQDEQGVIWVSTRMGISYLVPVKEDISSENINHLSNQWKIKTLNRNDGLKTSSFSIGSSLIDSENRIWWGGSEVLSFLDLDEFRIVESTPEVFLRQIDINGNHWDFRRHSENTGKDFVFDGVQPFENYPDALELSYNNNHLTFYFSAINWNAPHKLKYSHRIMGLDESWSNPSSETKVDYRNLPYGTFVFQVRAIGSSQVWSEPFEYTFKIRPPWWLSWWAYSIYLIFLILIGRRIHLFQKEKTIRQEREKSRERELAQAKEIEKAYFELEKAHDNLKKTQDQLIQQEKLASLGQLTAGIAHEIKNPLNFVNNFSDVSIELIDEAIDEVKAQGLALQPQEDIIEILSDIKSNLRKIHEHGSRADSIVRSMLLHSRGGTGKMEPTDLNTLIREYVNLSFHGMRAGKDPINVDIQFDLDESIDKVNLVGEDFSRVILNLCNNAFDAMREIASIRSAKLSVRTKQGKGAIVFEIEDNGPGIPDEIKDKILQPFFTTKKGTQGTGLGLSITHDIVKAHGGKLSIESIHGNDPNSGMTGTTFIISLPLT